MDALTIKPAAAPLTRGGPPRRRTRLPSWRATALSAAALALAALLGWIVLALPERVQSQRLAAPPPSGDAAVAERGPAAQVTPPFRRLELERAERGARESLSRFVALSRALEEQMRVAAWGQAELDAATDRAVAADQLFLQERYAEALAEYEAAVGQLLALRERGGALHDAALARGGAALAARQPLAATEAFAAALAIRPQSQAALAGARRATAQPRALALMREAERARLRGDLAAAAEALRAARAVDADTPGLAAAHATVRRQVARSTRERTLSTGFSALRAGNFDAAERAFKDVLAASPQEPAALDGLRQTAQQRTLAEIERHKQEAQAQEARGDWPGALASYAAALAVDGTLRFARDGQARLTARIAAVAEMQALLEDPAALSEDAAYKAAQALLAKAQSDPAPGAAYAETVAAFAALLARAGEPLPLVLVSDNSTSVTIHKVGRLGAFERRELTLRPGRYTIVGSRDGCRDVRKEIVLAPDMAPVRVHCEERI